MKFALVTGASSGIGKEISKELALQNFSLLIVARSKEELLKTKEELLNINTTINIFYCIGDISEIDTINAIQNIVETHFGKLDVLVNNAGCFSLKSLLEIENNEMDNIIEVNFKSPLLLIKALFSNLKKSTNPHIINISSDISLKPSDMGSIYGASKAALNYITKSLAIEFSKYNIKVNAIAPGAVNTPMLDSVSKLLGREINTLLGEKVEPRDIAVWIGYIIQSKSLTGSIISIDGGNSL